MKSDGAVLNVDTIEELTVHSLNCTGEGLDELAAESRDCARALGENPPDGLRMLGDLASKIEGFGTFHGDIISLFQIDAATITDATGSLDTCEQQFQSVRDAILLHLGNGDAEALTRILAADLPNTLGRFKELLPVLSDYIEKEYILPEASVAQ